MVEPRQGTDPSEFESDIEAARAAINTITKSDCLQCKRMNSPHPKVIHTMNMVNMLLSGNTNPSEWPQLQQLLDDSREIKRLCSDYDVTRITPTLRNACRKIISDNRLTADDVLGASQAATAFFTWVTSLVGMPEMSEEESQVEES